MRISDWSSDVCSSDLGHAMNKVLKDIVVRSASLRGFDAPYIPGWDCHGLPIEWKIEEEYRKKKLDKDAVPAAEFRAQCRAYAEKWVRSEEHTSELQSLMRISYAVFCLKNNITT